jgi:hypothetical protein
MKKNNFVALQIPIDIYKELIFGYNMNDKEKKEIIAIVKNMPNLNLFQSFNSNGIITVAPIER